MLSAFGIGIFQVVGSFGAADDQPERKALDGLALLLVVLGPLALALRYRWPLVAVAVAAAAADVYIGLGYPYGPIFLSVVVSLFNAVHARRGRAVWWLAGPATPALWSPRSSIPESDHPAGGRLVGLAPIAGWLAVVVSVSEWSGRPRSLDLLVDDVGTVAVYAVHCEVGEAAVRCAGPLKPLLGQLAYRGGGVGGRERRRLASAGGTGRASPGPGERALRRHRERHQHRWRHGPLAPRPS